MKVNSQITVLVLIMILAVSMVFISSYPAQDKQVSGTNYLLLAKMGIIPSKQVCSHTIDYYYSTGVKAIIKGQEYIILQSKFGDESCLARIG